MNQLGDCDVDLSVKLNEMSHIKGALLQSEYPFYSVEDNLNRDNKFEL
jgi:hypothetical protein